MTNLTRRPLASPSEVAEYLGFTVGQLAQMRYLGTGPAFTKPSGRKVRYAWDDVDQWLATRRFTQTSQAPATAAQA